MQAILNKSSPQLHSKKTNPAPRNIKLLFRHCDTYAYAILLNQQRESNTNETKLKRTILNHRF